MAKRKQKPDLSALEIHALKILARKADDRRDELDVGGGQPVDFTIRVSGAIDVQGNINYDTPAKPEPVDMVALMLTAVGTRSRNAVLAALQKAYRPLRHGTRPSIPEADLIAATNLISDLAHEKKKSQRGGVVGSLKLERLGEM